MTAYSAMGAETHTVTPGGALVAEACGGRSLVAEVRLVAEAWWLKPGGRSLVHVWTWVWAWMGMDMGCGYAM